MFSSPSCDLVSLSRTNIFSPFFIRSVPWLQPFHVSLFSAFTFSLALLPPFFYFSYSISSFMFPNFQRSDFPLPSFRLFPIPLIPFPPSCFLVFSVHIFPCLPIVHSLLILFYFFFSSHVSLSSAFTVSVAFLSSVPYSFSFMFHNF